MRRLSFQIPQEELDDVLDGIMPMLPLGIRLAPAPAGFAGLTVLGTERTLPTREELEEAARRELIEFAVEDGIPADWRARRAASGRRIVIGGKLVVRSPVDPKPENGYIDVVVERKGTGFGSGAHPTTRMCLEMLVRLEPHGGLTDIGCGIGTLAIAAGKLGWGPLVGLDRDQAAVEAAFDNAERNGIDAEFGLVDLAEHAPPYNPTLLVNAPPQVHEKVAEDLPEEVTAVVLSSFVTEELDKVTGYYERHGLEIVEIHEQDHWAAVTMIRPGSGRALAPEAEVEPEPAPPAPTIQQEEPPSERDPMPDLEQMMDPDLVAEVGDLWGQTAANMDDGTLVVSSARLLEFGSRGTMILVPGLFRFDLAPDEESVGVTLRELKRVPVRWQADMSTIDGFRREVGDPLVFQGVFTFPEGSIGVTLQVLSVTDGDQNGVHLVAKAAVRPK